jgi:hypothetical protein
MTISPDCRNGCKDFDIVNLCAFRQIQRCRSPITDTPGSATPRRARVTATRARRRGDARRVAGFCARRSGRGGPPNPRGYTGSFSGNYRQRHTKAVCASCARR